MERAASYLKAAELLLRPVIRFCVKHGLSTQQVIEITKKAIVDAAKEELERDTGEVNVSRVSAATGLHRRDVVRFLQADEVSTSAETSPTLASRVLTHWQTDKRFLRKDGKPRALRDDRTDLSDLVSAVGTDLNPTTVLTELERRNLITRSKGRILLRRGYVVPRQDIVESFRIAQADCDDIISSVGHNVFCSPGSRNLHARTEFDNISRKNVPVIREWLLAEGARFHVRARRFLAKYDLDLNSDDRSAGGVRVALGTFTRIEETPAKVSGKEETS